jgi:polyferredoxin
MLGQRQEIARLQSDFYRDQFRKILRWLIYLVFVMFLLMATIFYLILFQPPLNYYANTTDGKILPMPQPK